VQILAISVDSQEESAQLKRDLHLGFPLLSDSDQQVLKRYGLLHPKGHGDADTARSANLLLDAKGIIRWTAFTDNFRVRPHPEDVLREVERSH
jgi:peroxiredoxin